MPSLGASFGRGAMTNHWLDLQHSKVFLIAGSNAAENHVMSMKWIQKARAKGAKIIHVDPRFTRTSAIADVYARIRPGTDIAYLGAMINYILTEKLYDDEYVRLNTNADYLVKGEFKFEDGLFSGFDDAKHKYDNASWGYQLDEKTHLPKKAASLDDPNCVLQKVREHFSRYTFAEAEAISGIPAAQIKEIADLMVANKPGTIMYALGMTQHTTGVQGIRCYPIIQLLLGNIGVAGGGVNALRGEPNVQGSSDMALLYNYMPGYLSYPNHNQPTLEDWTKSSGTFRRKFLVSTLKAWFGENATPENDFGYGWIAKKNAGKNYSIYRILETAIEGKTKLLYVMGQNPLVTNANLKVTLEGLKSLEMLVVQDLWETETAAFWQAPGVDAKAVKTEVIALPAAYFMEKEGTIAGSGRMIQWRFAGVKPPGQAKDDLEIIDTLFRKVRSLYEGSADPKDAPILKASWDYKPESRYEDVLKEINGKVLKDVTLADGKVLKAGDFVGSIPELQGDGSTSGGAWIYAGIFKGGKNLSKRRDNKKDPSGLGIYPEFAWTWPGNIHVLYNRASAGKDGKPRAGVLPLVWWDEEKKTWAGNDNPDVPVKTDGPDTENGQRPFRMTAESVARLFAAPYKHPDLKLLKEQKKELPRDSSGVLADGPLPEFYEPVESPFENSLHPKVASNPTLKYPRLKNGMQPIGTAKDFPYVLSTASMTEHWCAGSVTRNVPWLNELAPEPWVELPEQLAAEKKIRTGDMVKVWSARGEVTVKARVTKRMATMKIHGKEQFVVWMPYNWGFKGLSTAPSTNYLTIDIGDPNTWCQETKACLVNLAKAEAKLA